MSIYNIYKFFLSAMILVSIISGLLFFPFFPYILVILIPISLSILQRRQRHGGILPRSAWDNARLYLLFPLPFLAIAAFLFFGIANQLFTAQQCGGNLDCFLNGSIGVVIAACLCGAIGLGISETLLWNFSPKNTVH